jgi:hypothetical protein
VGRGRPKIDRLVVKFSSDENTVLAQVLAGDQLDYTNFQTLMFAHDANGHCPPGCEIFRIEMLGPDAVE